MDINYQFANCPLNTFSLMAVTTRDNFYFTD